MASSHQNQSDPTSKSDFDQVLKKLADTQDQLHNAQEQISTFKATENEYQFTITSLRQQLVALKTVVKSNQISKHLIEEYPVAISGTELNDESDQYAQVLSNMRSELEALRKDSENRQIQWTSEKLLLEVDLNQFKNELLQCHRRYSSDFQQQAEFTEKYVVHSEEVIRLLQEKLADANKINERMQNDIVKLSLDKDRLQSRLCDIQKQHLKARGTASEITLTHAAAVNQQNKLVASLRKELARVSLKPPHRRNSDVQSTEGEDVGNANIEEAALIREFNSTLFEKLAASEDQIGTLKHKIYVLKEELQRSRQEVYNYVHRVKTGALIVDSNGCKTDWNASMRSWSRPEDRIALLQKMELLLQETVLENIQLTKEKNELGQQLINQHDSVKQSAL